MAQPEQPVTKYFFSKQGAASQCVIVMAGSRAFVGGGTLGPWLGSLEPALPPGSAVRPFGDPVDRRAGRRSSAAKLFFSAQLAHRPHPQALHPTRSRVQTYQLETLPAGLPVPYPPLLMLPADDVMTSRSPENSGYLPILEFFCAPVTISRANPGQT